jgi:hypothetical protein
MFKNPIIIVLDRDRFSSTAIEIIDMLKNCGSESKGTWNAAFKAQLKLFNSSVFERYIITALNNYKKTLL